MLWVPAASAEVEHAAVRVLPLPVSATAEQPEIEELPSMKLTLPVGATPVTVAVKVTLVPTTDGLAELAMVVALMALTTCDNVGLADPVLPASPP